MGTDFLLITNSDKITWLATFEKTISQLGFLRVTTEEKGNEEFLKLPYELVIIDAATIEEPVPLARKLHDLKPDTRIAVMTTVPTWREARDVLRAGVVDYFPSTLSSQELRVTIKTILQEEINDEPGDNFDSG